MSKHGQRMSQVIAEMQIRELKMNDPKLNKIFDKLKKGNTVKIKHSSTLDRGKDFIEYIVKSKNVVNKGRVEKITLASKDNPTAVKKFLYKRDGKVTFAVGDMAASIDDIKEKYSVINHEIIEDIEEVELDEGAMKDLLIKGKDLEAYAKKHGGIDKNDMMKVAAMLKKGDKSGALKYAKGMDTDPRDYILDLMGEEVELDEALKGFRVDFGKGMTKGSATYKNKKDAEEFAARRKRLGELPVKITQVTVKNANMFDDPMGPKRKRIPKEDLGKEDEPKVKEIIKKLKGASQAHAGQAKDLEKAISENSKGKEMSNEKMTDGNLSLKETVLKMWQEAVSPAQQAAIAISKKEKGEKPKDEKDEGNAFGKALKDAKDKGEKTFTVAGKTYDVQTEKLVGGQKKLDKDKDGDIDGKDFAMLRKSKKKEQNEEFSTPEYERYLQTKQGSLRESILKIWGEVVEEGYKPIKANHYDVKVTVKDKDVAKVKKIISNFKGDIEDVDSDQVDGGGMKFKGTGDIFIQGEDAGKLGMEIAKAVRTAKVMGEDKDLTKETKDGKNKMTDTGKEMTPVEMAPKMPKIKNEKNKV